MLGLVLELELELVRISVKISARVIISVRIRVRLGFSLDMITSKFSTTSIPSIQNFVGLTLRAYLAFLTNLIEIARPP